MNGDIIHSDLFLKIADLLQAARQNVVRTINQTMVYTYFEIGRMIVEDEQQGKERAEYGKQVLEYLAQRLTQDFGKGFSVVNLRQMRAFYLTYSIQQTTSAELQFVENKESAISETVSRKFILSWSHYLKLMRIENPDERSFYEIECAANNWSLMQMYVNYHDRIVKLPDENPTVGIILCKQKSDVLVEITLPQTNDQIFAARYHTVLPDKQTFINLLNESEI